MWDNPFAKKLQKLWKKDAKQGKRKKRKNGVRDWISIKKNRNEKARKQILIAHNQGVPGSSPGGPTWKSRVYEGKTS